jgi:cell shape-determining protein MreC
LVRLSEELAKLKPELAEKEKLAEAAQKREKEAEERLAAAEQTIKRYQEPIMRAGTSGRVISVNSGWNFLITDLGDNKGATPNSPLVVMRGSQMVGRARITQVEPGTSVADIIPGSVPRGTSVQPGDKVVFAGRANTPEKPGGEQGAAKPAEGAGAKKAGTAPAPALPQ